MQRLVTENYDNLQNACAELIKRANENGGEDNITVVIAKFTGGELAKPVPGEVRLELIDFGGIHDTADQMLEDSDEDTAEIEEEKA
jgi:serine/threonine protein phosphatase PrpC